MIHRCTIVGSDNTTAHHCCENRNQAQNWNEDLKLLKQKELVQADFMVCKKHFTFKDYKSDIQLPIPGLTAPRLSERYKNVEREEFMSGNVTDSESIEVVSSTCATMKNLKRLTLLTDKYNSASSNMTYSHDDICILEARDSHYGIKQCSTNNKRECELIQSLDPPDFTVLKTHAEDVCKLKTPQNCLCSLEESTEVISSCQTEHQSPAMSGTDSDVEILLSDEIVYSDWSADNRGELVTLSSADSREEAEKSDSDHEENVSSSGAFKLTEFTEHNRTEKDISLQSMDAYKLMTHAQLIRVIKEQASKMSHMEADLKRYRESQHALFLYVDALRQEFDQLEGATK